ncbi:GrpB family protein [Coxiella burnetii]|uniref:Glutamate-rich protein n=2 Tax=Coxiella burnetii TaxID=777 RepID=Q83EE3_COXBU|nr:GrpB family protein [Coxiella burnetii]NP_819420.2 glutamate-rich protein [Coxiella burnetii RSA 493]AAO89934.2 glutamate-rich protein [Coxiella burnetii RSA 493]ARI65265.1 hypothetical protein B7L74_01960 [Coxiella burnetii]MCF2093787.1 GrpB family protein [Coxiella burnetii]MCF2095559.1 GrpB family protein [Coxiella burnetii]MCF2097859.1 GrpB family protein [Coxiella burnetii]
MTPTTFKGKGSMIKRQQIIEVVPYDPDWSNQFEKEALLLKLIFSDIFVAIHHIGSTSVPGLAAKPTIDIILEVKDIRLVDKFNEPMEKLGYEAWGEYGIPGRRFFVKGESKRTNHVHTFQAGDREIARHLYFRDYLKSHPAEAKKYADLKIKLAQKLPHDRRGYVQNKQGYVEALEKKAIAWVRDLK